ncbi:MAG: hypothetical protein ACLGJD_25795, partial [Gammaproteobacteria bacterium]
SIAAPLTELTKDTVRFDWGPAQQLAFDKLKSALQLGGRCEGPPGLRPHYHAHYYGAYFRDLDGNKLGLACHAPEEGGPIQSPSTHSST